MRFFLGLAVAWSLQLSMVTGEDGTPKLHGELYGTDGVSLEAFLGDDPLYVLHPLTGALAPPRGAADQPPLDSGIIDTGINPRHPQLAGRIAEMVSFTNAGPEDTLGHGTAVAAALMSAGGGQLYSARVTDSEERVDLDAVLAAIDWMVERKVPFINMSLGFDPGEPRAVELCTKLLALESLPEPPRFFVAAGNRGPDWHPVPASCGSALVTVVATNEATSGRGDLVVSAGRWLTRAAYLVVEADRLVREGDFAGAIANGEEAARLDPTLAVAQQILAVANFRLSRTPLALEHAGKAMALDRTMTQAIFLHGLAAANLGRREIAIASLERLIAVSPEYPGAAPLLAFIRDESHALPQALKDFFENEDE